MNDVATPPNAEQLLSGPVNAELITSFMAALRGRPSDHHEGRNLYQPWHGREQSKAPLHTSVDYMLRQYAPVDYEKLILEWPHVSRKDDNRLAYTRNPVDGDRDLQLVTSIGKYLVRHWPHVPDHLRRDAAALYTVDRRVIVDTTPEMIYTIEVGPRSCMASVHGSIPFNSDDKMTMLEWYESGTNPPDWTKHPYWCYDPALGWSMAQRWAVVNGTPRLDGRALIYSGPAADGKNIFVRTYRRNQSDPVAGWSETDFALTEWLKAQGYVADTMWPHGAQIRTRPNEYGSSWFMPFIDGGSRLIKVDPATCVGTFTPYDERGDGLVFVGENTNGWGEDPDRDDDDADDDDYFYCEDCQDRTHVDDGYWVSRGEDRHICSHCCDNSYSYVRAQPDYLHSRGAYTNYYLHYDDACSVHDQDWSIDPEYPPDNVVCLGDGSYALRTDSVEVETLCGPEWFLKDDNCVVLATDGTYIHSDLAVFCEDTGNVLHKDDAYLSTKDDKWYEKDPEAEAEVEVEST